MSTAAWLVLAALATVIAGYLGFLAGREGAESKAAQTIADLRVALRRANGAVIPARDTSPNRYLSDDETGRPE